VCARARAHAYICIYMIVYFTIFFGQFLYLWCISLMDHWKENKL